ncbi:uncharacterized protein ARMOST_11833 [Armillaria ostoyae]|uniref:Uncharacterized protein n=1 Tax=Armillaria ostoyae TaxID=47428 RepID=A0A284RI86_ARMOS|nr:uncharacterized protein ARMOST_11833 [Armillaria ostoyae]
MSFCPVRPQCTFSLDARRTTSIRRFSTCKAPKPPRVPYTQPHHQCITTNLTIRRFVITYPDTEPNRRGHTKRQFGVALPEAWIFCERSGLETTL